jgi:hypothetical protein
MQSRYIGSDRLLQQQNQAVQESASTSLEASARIGKATQATTNTIIQGQAQLSKLSTALTEAEATAAASQTGLAGFATAAGKAVVAYKEQENRSAEAKERAAQEALKAAAAARAEQQARNKVAAAEELSAIDNEYAQDNWGAGVNNYKNATSRVLAKYDLKTEDMGELFSAVNRRAVERSEQMGKSILEGEQKTQAQLAASKGLVFQRELASDIARVGKLPPTEQMRPYLDNIDAKMEQFLKLENGLSLDEKLAQVVEAQKLLLPQVLAKGEGYADYVAKMQARSTWIEGHNVLNAKLASGEISLAEYKSEKAAIAITTGVDLDKYTVAPGETEKAQLEIATTIKGLDDLNRVARENLGKSYDFGEAGAQTLAAGIVVNPALLLQLEADPYLKDNPTVRSGIELAKRIQAYEADLGGLGVDRATANKNLQDLNLSNVRNVAEITRSIARKQNSGQPLTSQEKIAEANFALIGQVNPAIAEYVAKVQASRGTVADTAAETKALQDTLTAEAGAIENIKQSVIEQYNAQYQAVVSKHQAVIDLFGGAPTRQKLAEYYRTGMPALNQKLEQFKQDLSTTGTAGTPSFGASPNFRGAGELGATRQPNGSYSVAPKSRVHVQTNRGTPFITPLAADVRGVNHSFNTGLNGGGYRAGRDGGSRAHAGIDFPLNGGQKAVSVVSGQVLHVGIAQGYGGFVDVQGDNGFVYRYGHVRSFVQKGQRLAAGDAVATPNGSGVGGHHLHFEVLDGKSYHARINKQTGVGAWGINGTVDPIAHLRDLTARAGTSVGNTTTDVRGQSRSATFYPGARVLGKSLLTPGGGALQSNLFQQIGQPVQNASRVFTAQRPLNTSSATVPYTVTNRPYNHNDDLGYAFLRNSPPLMQQMHRTAQRLGVPTTWIADIAAQESGAGALAMKVHPGSRNQNFGLFGFGADSGVRNWLSLSPVQQVVAYEKYMLENGWAAAKARNGAGSNIAQFWAITRMGTGWRKEIINGRDPNSLKLNDTGKTYADELRLLGNHVGRAYQIPGGARSPRSQRNRGVRSNRRASTASHHLADTGTFNLATRDT